jgi:hypothetical protein
MAEFMILVLCTDADIKGKLSDLRLADINAFAEICAYRAFPALAPTEAPFGKYSDHCSVRPQPFTQGVWVLQKQYSYVSAAPDVLQPALSIEETLIAFSDIANIERRRLGEGTNPSSIDI